MGVLESVDELYQLCWPYSESNNTSNNFRGAALISLLWDVATSVWHLVSIGDTESLTVIVMENRFGETSPNSE